MSITIALKGSQLNTIDFFIDERNTLYGMFPSEDDRSYRCLGFVDAYGHTMFNYLQMDSFLSELDRVAEPAPSDEATFLLERVREFAQRCAKERLYLWFHGD